MGEPSPSPSPDPALTPFIIKGPPFPSIYRDPLALTSSDMLNLDFTIYGHPSNMLKIVHYVVQTVGKRAVCIQLKCILVTVRNSSFEKVMFLQVSVCPQWGRAWQGVCMGGEEHPWQERRPLQRTVRILLECILVVTAIAFTICTLSQTIVSGLTKETDCSSYNATHCIVSCFGFIIVIDIDI